jgi:hypothetical protein
MHATGGELSSDLEFLVWELSGESLLSVSRRWPGVAYSLTYDKSMLIWIAKESAPFGQRELARGASLVACLRACLREERDLNRA